MFWAYLFALAGPLMVIYLGEPALQSAGLILSLLGWGPVLFKAGRAVLVEINYQFRVYRNSLAITPLVKEMEALAKLSEERYKFLAGKPKPPVINVSGPRVTWSLGGVNIPAEFAPLWYDEWKRRGEGREGPAQRDFDRYTGLIPGLSREQLRQYAKVIQEYLKREGWIDDPGGPMPFTFIVDPHQALSKMGFWKVLGLVQMIEGEE